MQVILKTIKFKLMINTLYGVFASQYFKLKNTVLADNITAKTRAYVWLQKQMKIIKLQTITDGSRYGLNEVFYINKKFIVKNPLVFFLFNISNLKKHRSIKKGQGLIGFRNLKNIKVLVPSKLAKKQICDFWDNYNIKFAYEIEHNPELIYIKTSYFGKGNYALKTYNFKNDSKIIYKIRGQIEFCNGIINPIFIFLENILNGVDSKRFKKRNKNHY